MLEVRCQPVDLAFFVFILYFGLGAGWRHTNQTLAQLLGRLRAEGVTSSHLLGALGFQLSFLVIDCTHTLDLGVTQDTLGNLCWFLLGAGRNLVGRSQEERLQKLWAPTQGYYNRCKPATCLQKLTKDMVKQKTKAPKL